MRPGHILSNEYKQLLYWAQQLTQPGVAHILRAAPPQGRCGFLCSHANKPLRFLHAGPLGCTTLYSLCLEGHGPAFCRVAPSLLVQIRNVHFHSGFSVPSYPCGQKQAFPPTSRWALFSGVLGTSCPVDTNLLGERVRLCLVYLRASSASASTAVRSTR